MSHGEILCIWTMFCVACALMMGAGIYHKRKERTDSRPTEGK